MNLAEKPFYLDKTQEKWVFDTLNGMTTEEKIGQLFCVLGDAYREEQLCELIETYYIGGVLFRPDFAEEVKKKYSKLDKYAKYPLLKAANLEEGGAGVLRDGTYFGSQMQVAAADDLACTANFAKVCALEGKQVGINWTFSPVVDIDMNFRNPITNVRTFGSDVETVRKNASVYVRELQRLGVAASCKHFPGDGVDYRDQHLHPSYNDLSAKEWYASFGSIYQSLIEEGLMSIMVGHIVQPNVIRDINPDVGDAAELPASLSREMLTGVLREKFGFEGVVITDATIMGGYTMAMERKRAIPASIQAGCDMICFTTDIFEDISYIKTGLETGILTTERLDEAVMRILALKAKVALATEIPENVSVPAKEWCRECIEKSITLVKDIQSLVPVKKADYPRIRLAVIGSDEMTDGSIRLVATETLKKYGFEVENYNPFEDDLHGSSNLPQNQLTLILANYQTASNNVTVRIAWCPKHAMEIPRFVNEEKTAFISFANPYHLQDVPRVRTYINAYTATSDNVRIAIEKLLGHGEFTGVSPVDAFCGLRDTRL